MGGATTIVPQGGAASSIVGTFQNLVKPFVGAGILALPVAYYQGGVVASTLMIMCMAIVAVYCIQCLLACLELLVSPDYQRKQLQHREPSGHGAVPVVHSHSVALYANASSPLLQSDPSVHLLSSSPSSSSSSSSSSLSHDSTLAHAPSRVYTEAEPPSFREIGYAAFGKVGMFALDVSLAASQLGFCATYMNFVGSTMPTVISHVTKTQWILLMFVLQCVLCQIRRISTIAFTSTLGNLVYAVSIVIIFYVGFSSSCCSNASHLKLFDATGLPAVFGTACFALEGIGLVLPVKFSMSLEDRPRFNGVLYAAVVLVTTLYIVFGGLGYLFFGAMVLSPVTNNLDSWSVVVVNASLSLSLFFSYIIQLYPVMEMSDDLVRYIVRRSTIRAAGLSDDADEFDSSSAALPSAASSSSSSSSSLGTLYVHGMTNEAGGVDAGSSSMSGNSMGSHVVAGSAVHPTFAHREGVRSNSGVGNSGIASAGDAHVVATSSGPSSSASSMFSPRRSLRTQSNDASAAPPPSSSSSSSSASSSSLWGSGAPSSLPHHHHAPYDAHHAASLLSVQATLESPAYARRVFIYECTLRVLIVAFTALVALVVPNMKFLIDLTGALANSMIAFVLPTLYYLKLVVHPQYPLFDPLLVGEPFHVRYQHYRPWIVPTIIIVIAIAASVIGVESTIASVI